MSYDKSGLRPALVLYFWSWSGSCSLTFWSFPSLPRIGREPQKWTSGIAVAGHFTCQMFLVRPNDQHPSPTDVNRVKILTEYRNTVTGVITLCKSDICWCLSRISFDGKARRQRRHANLFQSISSSTDIEALLPSDSAGVGFFNNS